MRPDFTWDGAVNARPIAGDIYRMGRREWLTASGWEQLKAAGVRTVIDLRLPSERGKRATDPEVAAAAMAGIEIIELPLEDEGNSQYWALCQPYMNSPAHYVHVLKYFPERVAAVFSALAKASGPTAIHCSAGRDRTGLISTLLLLLLDKREDALEQDELAVRGINSYRLIAPRKHPYEHFMAEAELRGELSSRAADLTNFFEFFEATSVEQWLLGAGVDLSELELLKTRHG